MRRDADHASRLLTAHVNETMHIVLRTGFGGAQPKSQETSA